MDRYNSCLDYREFYYESNVELLPNKIDWLTFEISFVTNLKKNVNFQKTHSNFSIQFL